MSRNDDRLSADLEALGTRLRDERPTLDPLVLDGVAQRARRTAAAPVRRRRGSLAVALCLSLGLIFSSAGTGMAISGLSSTSGTAAQAQYPGSAGVSAQGETTTTPTLGGGGGSTTPSAQVQGSSGGSSPSQATQQVSAAETNSTLPFTGFAAIPVVVAGLALLLIGLFLRRRNSHPAPPAL